MIKLEDYEKEVRSQKQITSLFEDGIDPNYAACVRYIKKEEAKIAELLELLKATKKYVPYGAFKGNILSHKLDDIRLVNLIDEALEKIGGGE